MLTDLKVKIGPQFYQYHMGAIDNASQLFDEYQARRILIVHGDISWKKAKPFLSFLNNTKYYFVFHQYSGECSYVGGEAIKSIAEKEAIDFIVGVGGGKLADLVGYAGHISNLPFGQIPTLASNCAPWTPLSVMYKENGESEGKSEHFLRQAAFLITDPHLVIDSPVEYFIAGIVDTLAKWYESDAILSQDELQKETSLMLAKHITIVTKNQMLTDSDKAIDDMKKGIVSDEFFAISEIVFALAGLIGGLGDKYARNAAAHALHDGLGKYTHEIHNYLHGEIVGYGMLYQMALENRYDEVDRLIHFYQRIGTPISLEQMGVHLDEITLNQVVEFMNSKEKVHLIPVDTSKEALKAALINIEQYVQNNF